MTPIDSFWALAGLMITIFVLSVIFKDNPFFRFAEHTIVGAAAGYYAAVMLQAIGRNGLSPIIEGKDVWVLIPFILGILVFAKWTKWGWMCRYPIAILVSTGTGLALRSAIQAQIISQVQATWLPISTTNLFTTFSNLILITATLCCTAYFLFTAPQKGVLGRALGKSSKLARYFLMITFGAGLASNSLNEYAYIITPVYYILDTLRRLLGLA